MDANFRTYDHVASFGRIDAILALPASNYEEVKELPDRDRLTYTNGFYASCSALFVDIRGSSSLPGHYQRPALAKIYRAYISETVAVMNGNPQAREINIVGDCVWGVFNTPWKSHIDAVFSAAARLNSLVRVLNSKMVRSGYGIPISVGVGLDYGRALMIKAGSSGSGIADVVYMGDVVNHAAKLAAQGANGAGVPPVMLGNAFAANLNQHNTNLIRHDPRRGCYTANVVDPAMQP